MKRILRCLLNGVLSIITTILIMASPVAAIMYASEPAVLSESYTADMVAAVDGKGFPENRLDRVNQELDQSSIYRRFDVRDLESAGDNRPERVYTYRE